MRRRFPTANRLTVISEDMYRHTEAVLEQVTAFIGLPAYNWTGVGKKKYNVAHLVGVLPKPFLSLARSTTLHSPPPKGSPTLSSAWFLKPLLKRRYKMALVHVRHFTVFVLAHDLAGNTPVA